MRWRVFFPLSGASRRASPAPTTAPSAKPTRVVPVLELPRVCKLSFMIIVSMDRGAASGQSVNDSLEEVARAGPHAARHGGGGKHGQLELIEERRREVGRTLADRIDAADEVPDRRDAIPERGRQGPRFVRNEVEL